MKNIQLFDFNLQYPLHIDGETIQNIGAYKEFLIRKGYAKDPDAPIAPTITQMVDNAIESRFDSIEESVKKTFAKGRRIRGVSGEPRKNEGES